MSQPVRMNAFGNYIVSSCRRPKTSNQAAKCSLMSTADDVTIFVTLSETDIMDNQESSSRYSF
jgi:hypothetical protein